MSDDRNLGELVGEGRTSLVYAYGKGSVVKVPRAHIPPEWPRLEARYSRAVHSVGAPAPAVRDVVQIDGRDAVVFERVDGMLMWDAMRERPGDRAALLRELADLQRSIHALRLVEGLPDLVLRMHGKLGEVRALSPDDRARAGELVESLARGAAVLHGDLHPGNVLITASGLVAIDWFDVTIGHPIADVIRTEMLIRPIRSGGAPLHLPGAAYDTLQLMRENYREQFADLLSEVPDRWYAALALSRLAEAAEIDASDLWELWRNWRGAATVPDIEPSVG